MYEQKQQKKKQWKMPKHLFLWLPILFQRSSSTDDDHDDDQVCFESYVYFVKYTMMMVGTFCFVLLFIFFVLFRYFDHDMNMRIVLIIYSEKK